MPDSRVRGVVLVAEDDDDDFVLIESAYAQAQMPGELRRVRDGVELLQYLRREGAFREQAPQPVLVLLDLNMPRKDGREALHEMRADPRLNALPVIVLTTSRNPEDVIGSYRLGANSFISKPVTYRQLARVMQTLRSYWFDTAELPVAPSPRRPAPVVAESADEVQLTLPEVVNHS